MTGQNLSFIHRFDPGTDRSRPPLLLLHGTGGDETALIGLGREIAPGAALLSPRGAVLERGMPRFFRRLAEGVFDEADLLRRAGDLARFVTEARSTYGLTAPIAVGFSNGANIAAATLMLHPGTFMGAVLIRAMAPLGETPDVDLSGLPILMLSGSADPIVTRENAGRLAQDLAAHRADLDYRILPAGHALSNADVALATDWLSRFG
ncbi:MAG: alpha/beta hydrolase [Methylobacterium sp.]|uniref:alpha/beta hydrolase n=1 Tax=Methylobacterium sp. TaxID=409 RepID=UPI0025EDFBC9|nr:alpha/beta hydrolase [Methylobacterium sp.]MBX9929965.1 alpha/beta hydrolase [Methylobacterium sp.]